MGGLFRECADVQRDTWVQMGEGCYLHGGVTLSSKLALLLKREMISLKHPIQRPEVGFQDGSREVERESDRGTRFLVNCVCGVCPRVA